MKRCPQCQFIYPDSDEVCDFDQTPLLSAPESEIAAITNTTEPPDLAATHARRFQRRFLPIAAALGLMLGIVIFGVYFAVRRQLTPQRVTEQTNSLTTETNRAPAPSPSPSPSINETASPAQRPAATEKQSSSSSISTAHSSMSHGPVSTGGPGTALRSHQKPVILLTSGSRIEADEVWRTKDGVWYRRAGVVTLLNKNRVKAIVNQ
jgi:cytoskeletal protein RodZ